MIKLIRFLRPYKKQCIVGPLFKLFEAILELLSKKTDEKYVWKFVIFEYFSYVGNINNKRRRLIGYL